jgi:serine/threonine protein phosphatase PrpC
MQFQFGNHSDIGKVRNVNEDYLGYFNTQNGHVFVVCDGMGGHVGGAAASQLAVGSIRTFFEHQYYDHPREALRQSVLYANGQIYVQSQQTTELRGMGTTCVVLLVREEEVYYAHVGDSRIYQLSGSSLTRLTKDHSYVQTLVDQGVISNEEAETHPRRNELTRALGVDRSVEVEVCSMPLPAQAGDLFMLCTDGLFGVMNDALIRQLLQENASPQQKSVKLVQRANEAGGPDNITVQIVQFESVHTSGAIPPQASVPVQAAQADTMSPRKSTPTKSKSGPNAGLIILGILIAAVVGLVIAGSKYLSDDPVENSELVTGVVDTTSTEENEEEPVPGINEESLAKSSTKEKETPVKSTPVKTSGSTSSTTPTSSSISSNANNESVFTHTVKPGDTFSSIARRYNVTRETLKAQNPTIKDEAKDLKADVTKLKIKVKAIHKVGPGDILDVVSKKYNVSKELIMAANGKKEDLATRGELLVIPFAEKK